MALEKEITGLNGVKSNYHRIDKVQILVLQKKALVTIKDYSDSDAREIEKVHTNKANEAAEISDKLEHAEHGELELTEEEKDAYSKKLEKLVESLETGVSNRRYDTSVGVNSIEINNIDVSNLNTSELYIKLKELDIYKNALDV